MSIVVQSPLIVGVVGRDVVAISFTSFEEDLMLFRRDRRWEIVVVGSSSTCFTASKDEVVEADKISGVSNSLSIESIL